MDNKNSLRNKHIDALKGFAILLVVVGHAIQKNITNFDDNLLFRIIYSFHMPLFMFLSGYVTWNRVSDSTLIWLNKKFKSLVIPFISWFVIYFFLGGISSSFGSPESSNFFIYIYNGIVSPDRGLWFLWVLFLISIVFAIAFKVSKKIGDISYFIFILILQLIPIGFLGIGLLKWHFTFYIAGYLFAKHKELLQYKSAHRIKIILILFPISVLGWHRVAPPFLYNEISYLFSSINYINVIISKLYVLIYNNLVAILGICFFYIIFKMLSKSAINMLAKMGLYTIEIYTSHYLFLGWSIGNGVLSIISTIIITLSMCFLLNLIIIKRNGYLSLFLLGKKRKKLNKKIMITEKTA